MCFRSHHLVKSVKGVDGFPPEGDTSGMDFKTYWGGLSADEKRALAKSCSTTVGYLGNLASEGARQENPRKCSPFMAAKIERASDGLVSRKKLARSNIDWDLLQNTG